MTRDESDALDARLDAHLAVRGANRTGQTYAIDRSSAWSHVHPIANPALPGTKRIAVVEPGEDEVGVIKRILGYRMNGTIPRALYEFATPHLPREPESKPIPRGNPDAPRGKVASSLAVRSLLKEADPELDPEPTPTAEPLPPAIVPEPVAELATVPIAASAVATVHDDAEGAERFCLSATPEPRSRRRGR